MGFYIITTNNQKNKLKKTPFIIASKQIKYLGINLTKEMKDLYSENYNTLMKKIEDDTNGWEYTPCSCIKIILLK